MDRKQNFDKYCTILQDFSGAENVFAFSTFKVHLNGEGENIWALDWNVLSQDLKLIGRDSRDRIIFQLKSFSLILFSDIFHLRLEGFHLWENLN